MNCFIAPTGRIFSTGPSRLILPPVKQWWTAFCCSSSMNSHGKKKAFINLSTQNLLTEYISALPNGIVVAELLETVEPDPDTIACCKSLKEKGYILALDDFVFNEKYAPLIEVADIIKVDFQGTQGEERKKVIRDVGRRNIKFLAEKVETYDEFDEAVAAGYSYFQGYFFSKPEILSRKAMPSYKPNLLLLLRELVHDNLNINKVEEIMKRDVSLSYKFLRFINSAAFGFFRTIRSIKHAISLIGINEFRKWMSVIVMTQLGMDKPDELMQQSVVRGKLSELITDQTPLFERKSEAFLMGMFSLIDVVVERSMTEILEQLPLADDIKDALTGEQNNFKDILDLVCKYERGDWNGVPEYSKKIDFPMGVLPDFYRMSVKWAYCIDNE